MREQVHLKNLFFLSFVPDMDDEYRTIEKPAEGIYREKGSRFLAFGYPVHSEDEAKKIIDGLRKKHHDARHHCYAYRLGSEAEIFRINDDGEPSGTGGKPVYQVLQAEELYNSLIVVVRYFGGILLGRNKLARAYKSAAMEVISNARIMKDYIKIPYDIVFPYKKLNEVMKILKEENVSPESTVIENTCSMLIHIRKSHSANMMNRLTSIEDLVAKSLDNLS